MNIQKQIQALLSQDLSQGLSRELSLEDQIEIIKNLNTHKYDPKVLFELVSELLKQAVLINLSGNMGDSKNILDVVGTGGDGFNTLNFSTLTSLVLASGNIPIAKHGNKSSTSKTGSFDLLEKLKLPIPQTPQEAEALFKKFGIVFLFAPYFHPVFKKIKPARDYFSALGEKTIFNLLGPFLNPARVKKILLGVSEEKLIEPFSEVLIKLGIEHGCVVHGSGLDEFNIYGESKYSEIKSGKIKINTLNFQDIAPVGADLCVRPDLMESIDHLKGGDPDQNAQESMDLLEGRLLGPKRDMVILNTAAALRVFYEFENSLHGDFKSWPWALEKAEKLLDQKNALKIFKK